MRPTQFDPTGCIGCIGLAIIVVILFYLIALLDASVTYLQRH